MTAAERKALVEQKLAEARAKIAAGLINLAVVIDPTVVAPTEPTPPVEPTPGTTPETPTEGGN